MFDADHEDSIPLLPCKILQELSAQTALRYIAPSAEL